MNNLNTLAIVFAVLAVVGVAVSIILPYIKKQGIDLSAGINTIWEKMNAISGAMELIRPFIQNSSGVDAFDKILGAAHVAVGNAEQLYNIGQLEPDKRKAAARSYVIDALGLLNVDITPEVEKLIDGAIEAEVLGLKGGKGNEQQRQIS